MKKVNLLYAFMVFGLLLMNSKSYGQFKGTYTIDTTGTNYTSNPSGASGYNYKSFSTAAMYLGKYGVSGSVIFKAATGTYSEQVSMGAISGASSTNTVTFQSTTGDSSKTIIQFAGTSTNNYVLSLTGTSYITFKKMTIQNTGTTYGIVVSLIGTCTYNSFLNDQLIGYSGGSSATQSIIYGNSSSAVNYNTFSYNNILNGYCSVYFSSTSATNASNTFTYNNMSNFYSFGFNLSNTTVITINYNNIVSNLSTAAKGIYASSSSGAMTYIGNTITITGSGASMGIHGINGGTVQKIVNNTITLTGSSTAVYGVYFQTVNGNNHIINNNTITLSSTSSQYGIWPNYWYGETSSTYTQVQNNKISLNGTTSSASVGIYWDNTRGSGTGTYPRDIIANNFIIQNNGTGTVYGIYTTSYTSSGSGNTDFLYNSIFIGKGNTSSYGIYHLANHDANNNFLDNIVYMSGASGVCGYPVYYSSSSYITTSDYNNYYAPNSPSGYIGYYNGSYYTFANWYSSTTLDKHSLNIYPTFNSTTDLHTTNVLLKAGTASFATGTVPVLTDIDGETRSTTMPYIGADEYFPPASDDAGISAFMTPVTPYCAGNLTVSVKLKNYGTDTLRSDTIRWTVNGAAQTPYAWKGTMLKNDSTIITLGSYNFSASTNYTIKAYPSLFNGKTKDVNHTNDTAYLKSMTINPNPASSYSINDTNQCFSSNKFIFTNNSTISSGTFTGLWKFGDGSTSTTSSPTYTYKTLVSPLTVTLLNTSFIGCKDSLKKKVYMKPSTSVSFAVNDTNPCFRSQNSLFTDNSTLSSGSYTRLWKFGDNSTSTSSPINHYYSTTGNYSVKIITTTNLGCKDSITKIVHVNPHPSSAFAITSDTIQCLGSNLFVFKNNTTISSGSFSSLWKFGDNSTSTITSPSHNYAYPTGGYYSVKLITTSNNGCKDSTGTRNVYITSGPTAGYTPSDTAQCYNSTLGNTFSFTNNTTVPAGSFTTLWKFGDGTTTTTTSPSHKFTATGNYSVRLVVTQGSCTDSTTKVIHVNPYPTASFNVGLSVSDTMRCRFMNFTPVNNSTISLGALLSTWKFGDGTTSTATSPAKAYSTAGGYTMKLVVASFWGGCKDSTTRHLTVNPSAVSNFTPVTTKDTSECLRGNNFAFVNTSTLTSGTFTNSWNFGDATTSTNAAPSHTYSAVGTFPVKLITTTNYGCKDSVTKNRYVRPHPATTWAFADTVTSKCLRGNSYSYNNTTTISSGTYTFIWKFGDNTTSTANPASHSYSTNGTFSPKLVTTSNYGCMDSLSKNVYIRPQTSVAWVFNDTITSKCLRGNSFGYNNSSTISSGTYSFIWKFGDNTTSTASPASHSYTMAGTFSPRLITTSNFGCKDSLSRNVYIRPHPATAYTSVDTSECLRGNNFVFTNNTTISYGTYSSYWKFGDGYTSTTSAPNHSYIATGTFQVRLITSSNFGCMDSITKNRYVRYHPVTSFFTLDTAECLKVNKFMFTNSSSIKTGTFTSLWKFGDNTTSTNSTPSHTYATVNTFTAKLITTSNYGCKDSISKTLYVWPNTSVAFKVSDTSLCLRGNSFTFTDNSKLSSGSYSILWKFGDDSTSIVTPATHVYNQPGIYSARLITTTNYNCLDSITQNIHINPHPSSSYNINNPNQCFRGNSFTFANTSSISSGTFTSLWHFGDGSTSATKSPTYSYKTNNAYVVKLITKSNYGCLDSVMNLVFIYPSDTAKFTINSHKECLGGTAFSFTNKSTHHASKLNTYWYFGDNTNTSTTNPTHSYLIANTYIVTLEIVSTNSCVDSIKDTVVVFPKPTAGIGFNDTAMCLSHNNFLFTDSSSSVVYDPITTYIWNYGDKTLPDTVLNSSHSYTNDSTFLVTHKVITRNGCISSAIKHILIFPQPKLSFKINDTSQCIKTNQFIFTNNSSIKKGSMTFLWNFGDSYTSTLASPTHSYKAVNSYPVKLVALSNYGCSDSGMQSVRLKPQPVVNLGKDTIFNINQWTDTIKLNFNTGLGYDSILWFNNTKYNTLVVDMVLKKDTALSVWVKVAKNGCFTTDTVKITINYKTTGIDNIAYDFNLSVYPNPTRDYVNIGIKGLRNDVVFDLTDMNGRIVQTLKVQASQYAILKTMDMAGLAKGIYFLNIRDNANKQSVKIVKY